MNAALNEKYPRNPAPRPPVALMENVTALRCGRPVFENTDWTIRAGEHWAVTGESGAGKSTLLNILCREIPVVSGRLAFFTFPEETVSATDPAATAGAVVSLESGHGLIGRHAAYAQARWQSFEGDLCPTAAELLCPRSVESRLAFQVDGPLPDPAGWQARRQYVTGLLEIDYLLDRKVLHLSSGEGKKLLLARALMKAPRLLLLDDPFSGLDADFRESLRQCLDQLMADPGGPTLVIATPRPRELPSGITHLVQVAGGRIVRQMPRPPDMSRVPADPAPLRTEGLELPERVFPGPLRLRSPGSSGGRGETPLFAVTSATVRYGAAVILDNVSWTVRPGENWALLGPNGAGKSTLLSLIMGDNPQCYANDVRVMGRRRGTGETIWDVRADIGYLSPDLQARYPGSTPCRQVVLSGFTDTIGCFGSYSPAQEQYALDWMQSLGIAELAGTPLGLLTPARQRLVLLARALVKDPPLLLLDEPCSSLDAGTRRFILDTLNYLCRLKRTTLVIVSHHPEEIPESVTRVLYLSQGKVARMESDRTG
ncbi:MAG: ATP-binding cassette domain-containing protein [Thermodesulfobacteriota bacterium]